MTTNFPRWLGEITRKRIGSPEAAYAMAPVINRAVNVRANALSSVPWRLTRRGVDVEWPWRTDLSEIIQQTERSLLITGGGYWMRDTNGRVLRGFSAINPCTMSVMDTAQRSNPFDPVTGAQFLITTMAGSYGPYGLDQVVYFREYSQNDDAQPGVSATAVALKSAELAWYLDAFTAAFFSGGAQPVTIVNVPESTSDDEMERISMMTESRTSSWQRAWKWLFVRSPDFKVEKLTPDINTMMMPELYTRVVTNVSMAFGIPLTMLTANAANYATAQSDRIGFYAETIVPRCVFYQRVINEQVLSPLGYKLEFLPEQLSVMQTDESQRATAFLQYTQGGIPPRAVAKILGIDGIDEFWPEAPIDVTPQPAQLTDVTPPPPSDTPSDAPVKATKSAEFGLLAKKIERRIKAGKSPRCTFEGDAVTAEEVAMVMARLDDASSIADVHDVIASVKAVDDLTPDERRIYDRIIKPMTARGEAWARQVLRGEVPESSMADIIGPALNAELAPIINGRIDRLSKKLAYPMEGAEERTLDWLNEYVPGLNREIDATTRRIIEKTIAQYRTTEGMTIDDVAKALRPAVDKARASAIAITEVTRAASHATIEYQKYLAEKGLSFERIWNTDADELVCPVCVPLNGKGEDVWITDYPLGPPAHVRCRCDTTLQLVED